jgi:fermentation-respiration switch protein FrsA (DUF1100 family)
LAARGGFNLFYFDFRNHGESGGRRTSLGAMESRDVESALDWLRANVPSAARRIGVYGVSMGAAAAIVAASRRTELAAVAAESSFTSVRRSIAHYGKLLYGMPGFSVPYTVWWLRLRLGFDPELSSPERHVAGIAPRPLFLLQGSADRRVPPMEGERLFAAAGEPKSLWTVPDGDHAGLWDVAGRAYEDRLIAFFRGVFG